MKWKLLCGMILVLPMMAWSQSAERGNSGQRKAKPKVTKSRKAKAESAEQEYQRLQEEYKKLLQKQSAPAPGSPKAKGKARPLAKPRKPVVEPAPRAEPTPHSTPEHSMATVSEDGESIKPRPSSSVFNFELVMWQEAIKISNGGLQAKMEAQSKGFMLSYDLHRSRPESNWQWLYGASIGVGSTKGIGDNPIPDQFNSQPFTMGVARVGLLYFSSPVAKAGLVIPLVYRTISWVYDEGSGTKADDVKFTAGVQALYIARLTPKVNFQASVTHQHMWETVVWAAGWGLNF